MIFPISARGAEKGVVPDLTWGTSSADQDRTAAAISDVGARWVRLNANWAAWQRANWIVLRPCC